MRSKLSTLVTGLAVTVVATACLGFGSWFHDSGNQKAKVDFGVSTKLKNGDVLPAGQYEMVIAKNSQSPTVEFYKVHSGIYSDDNTIGNKLVASVSATVKTGSTKNSGTVIHAKMQGNSQVLESIQPSGWDETVMFPSGR